MNGLKMMSNMKVWIRHLTEIGVFLVALSIVADFLFGEVVPFLSAGVFGNFTAMISGLGEEGLVGCSGNRRVCFREEFRDCKIVTRL